MFLYKVIDRNDEENWVYIATAEDIEDLWYEMGETNNFDRVRFVEQLDLLGIEYYIIYPENVIELTN